ASPNFVLPQKVLSDSNNSFCIENWTYISGTTKSLNDSFCRSVLPSGHRSDEGEEPFRNACTSSALFRPL
ncbi:hypothetical protein, partial [Bacteroides acidifaciens]|uniref:hypothetical protein n=1 Tax=Bacteroides acidifaciens TaxID=85831 RepID=UPI0026384D9D